jgi:hypothetical protein
LIGVGSVEVCQNVEEEKNCNESRKIIEIFRLYIVKYQKPILFIIYNGIVIIWIKINIIPKMFKNDLKVLSGLKIIL